MQSTTWGTDSETDVPCGVITLPLLCNKQVINCHIAALYQLTVALDQQTATGLCCHIYLPIITLSLATGEEVIGIL